MPGQTGGAPIDKSLPFLASTEMTTNPGKGNLFFTNANVWRSEHFFSSLLVGCSAELPFSRVPIFV